MERLAIEIKGQVQGVGFRPHVYRVAQSLALTGFVKNNASGVYIEAQGAALDIFLKRLQLECPPLASIEEIASQSILSHANETQFMIEKSEPGLVTTKMSPDASICDDCLRELFDSNSRYYHYPFINCTHCGPRYTITEKLPYDRKYTTMDSFDLCKDCQKDYENPLDRRYHAQPVACSACGPKLTHSLTEIADAIQSGKIVALKGLGGYQLICDAKNQNALSRLRKNKIRDAKPFALMVLNADSANQYVYCDSDAEKILSSRERPIVLCHKKITDLPEDIAPELNTLGVMLPYTPIHYLLFHALLGFSNSSDWLYSGNSNVLVVTSANLGGCPLIKDDLEAKQKLFNIADLIVHYNREILIRLDDSVVNIINKKPAFVRRARSYVPKSIPLAHDIPPTLALGGYLKNTICITRGKEAFVSQHIGDLNNRETIRFYRETIHHLLKILDVKPACVAHDFHPDCYATQIAAEFDVPTFAIQHHHAHLAACAAEHRITSNAIGLALDGFGLGENNESWGGELMLFQGTQYQHLGGLKPLMQPGGDIAARQPWRMAVSALFELGKMDEIRKRYSTFSQCESIIDILAKNIRAPLTSSCGRLFDAASSLLDICHLSHYEGEAAMRLESQVTQLIANNSLWAIENNQLNLISLLNALLSCDKKTGANLFHGTLCSALVEWISMNAKKHNLKNILLSGGCFLNRVLSESMIDQLHKLELNPLYPRLFPPNDGGISLGQAWIAGNKMMEKM